MIALLLILFSTPVLTSELPATVAGDTAFVALRYDEARRLYHEGLSSSPHDPAVLWRMSRLSSVEGGLLSGEDKHAMYLEAERYARASIAADSTQAEGYTWLAVSLGNLAMFEGSKAKIRICGEIKRVLDRALYLNPNDDIAYTILGSFYRALGSVSWIERQLASIFLGSLPDGGYPEAEIALKKAISLAPGTLRHRKELGMLYVDWERDGDARKVLQECLLVPTTLASDPADKERIRETLSKLE